MAVKRVVVVVLLLFKYLLAHTYRTTTKLVSLAQWLTRRICHREVAGSTLCRSATLQGYFCRGCDTSLCDNYCVFTGYLPGAAAPGIDVPSRCTSSWLSFLAADRTSRLQVFTKEVHLPCTSFFESILETVYRLSVNILFWQIIPSSDDPLGKAVQTWITATVLLRQFPSVPSGCSVFGLFEKNVTKKCMTIPSSFMRPLLCISVKNLTV